MIRLTDTTKRYNVAITYDDEVCGEVTVGYKASAEECSEWLTKMSTENEYMLYCLDFDNPDYEWHTLEELIESGEIEEI